MLLWGDPSGNDSYSLKVSILLAVSLVLGWVLISSVPLAYGGSEIARKIKIKKMTASSSFNFCSSFVSQLFFVWLVATLLRPTSCVSNGGDPIMSTALSSEISCGSASSQSWSYRISLPLLLFLCLTSTMMHSSSDIELDERERTSYAAEYGAETDAKDLDADQIVSFNQLYSHLVQFFQIIICVTAATGLACEERAAPLAIIAVASLLMALVPLLIASPCSLSAVPWLRSTGALMVCWTAIVSALHTRPDSYPFATGSALYIGWLVIGVSGLFLVVLYEKRRYAKWIASINEAGLPSAVSSLLEVAGALTVDEAVSDKSVASQMNQHRFNDVTERIKHAKSLPMLCKLIAELESSILVERLQLKFLTERPAWKKNLLNISYEQPDAFNSVKEAIVQLRSSIRTPSALTSVSRNVLSLVLRRKCPEEIAWTIFGYMFDCSNIRRAVAKIIEREIGRNLISTFSAAYTEANINRFVYALRAAESDIFRPVILDNSKYGKLAGEEAPTAPELKQRRRSFDDIERTSLTTDRIIESDHLLALQLNEELNKRTYSILL
jgi:hypothetical protein